MDSRLIAHWSFDEGSGSQAVEHCSGRFDPIHYVFNETQYKPSVGPVWVDGVQGNALLFDGYSTWVDAPSWNRSFRELTIEAWIAPRSYEHGDGGRLSSIVNQHDRRQQRGFILGLFRHGACSFQVGTGQAWHEVWAAPGAVPRDEWSHVAAVWDGPNGRMALFVNGRLAGEKQVSSNEEIYAAQVGFVIGKNNEPSIVQGLFEANMFNGIIDELKLFERALPEGEIERRCNLVTPGKPDTKQRRSRYAGDRHRPEYHFIPPEHWMNEPHGPMYFNGQYHLFYQHNPHGPYWNQIHWGHAVSPDMVRWRDLPFALSPEEGSLDPDGCWSGGTTIGDDGLPVIYYAAGDKSRDPDQSVAMAKSTYGEDGDNDLIRWVKYPRYVAVLPEGVGLKGNFRDPFVWKEEGTWYMIVTSGIPDQGGTALLFTSSDGVDWTYRNPLYVGNSRKYPKTGDAWELPLLFPIFRTASGEQKHIFIVNPWFLHASPHYCKYIFYWIGTWDRERFIFTPDDEEPQTFDVGEHWIGPSGFIDPHGRIILFSVIFGMNPRMSRDFGWFGNAGLPVEIVAYEDGRIGVKPIDELTELRGAKLLDLADLSFEEADSALRSIQGDTLELRMVLEPGEASKFGLKVRVSPNDEEETLLYYDKASSSFWADRTRSSLEPDVEKGVEGGPVELDEGRLRLHLYLDKSMINCYLNGLKSLVTRIFPSRDDSHGLRLIGDETTRIKSLEAWTMNSAYSTE
mgnify:CR=1 FL=1